MRREVDVGCGPQRRIPGQGLGIEHIEDSAGKVPAAQGFLDRRLVEYGAAADVDEAGARLHQRELGAADEAPAFRGQRCSDHDYVGLGQELLQVADAVDLLCMRVRRGRATDTEHAHAERAARLGHGAAHFSQSYDKQGLAPGGPRKDLVPFAAHLVGIDPRHLRVDHQQAHQSELVDFLDVHSAVVGELQPGMQPVEGHEPFDARADHVDPLELRRHLGEVAQGEALVEQVRGRAYEPVGLADPALQPGEILPAGNIDQRCRVLVALRGRGDARLLHAEYFGARAAVFKMDDGFHVFVV